MVVLKIPLHVSKNDNVIWSKLAPPLASIINFEEIRI